MCAMFAERRRLRQRSRGVTRAGSKAPDDKEILGTRSSSTSCHSMPPGGAGRQYESGCWPNSTLNRSANGKATLPARRTSATYPAASRPRRPSRRRPVSSTLGGSQMAPMRFTRLSARLHTSRCCRTRKEAGRTGASSSLRHAEVQRNRAFAFRVALPRSSLVSKVQRAARVQRSHVLRKGSSHWKPGPSEQQGAA